MKKVAPNSSSLNLMHEILVATNVEVHLSLHNTHVHKHSGKIE